MGVLPLWIDRTKNGEKGRRRRNDGSRVDNRGIPSEEEEDEEEEGKEKGIDGRERKRGARRQFKITLGKQKKNDKFHHKKFGATGLRSPRLPHAKGVLYQMSYDPNCEGGLSTGPRHHARGRVKEGGEQLASRVAPLQRFFLCPKSSVNLPFSNQPK